MKKLLVGLGLLALVGCGGEVVHQYHMDASPPAVHRSSDVIEWRFEFQSTGESTGKWRHVILLNGLPIEEGYVICRIRNSGEPDKDVEFNGHLYEFSSKYQQSDWIEEDWVESHFRFDVRHNWENGRLRNMYCMV